MHITLHVLFHLHFVCKDSPIYTELRHGRAKIVCKGIPENTAAVDVQLCV